MTNLLHAELPDDAELVLDMGPEPDTSLADAELVLADGE